MWRLAQTLGRGQGAARALARGFVADKLGQRGRVTIFRRRTSTILPGNLAAIPRRAAANASSSSFESDLKLLQQQLAKNETLLDETREGITVVANEIATVKKVHGEALCSDEKASLSQDLKALKDKEKALMDEKKALMDEKKALMDEKKALMDEKKALIDKEKALMDEKTALMAERVKLEVAMSAEYLVEHEKWRLGGSNVLGPATAERIFVLDQDFAIVRMNPRSYLIDKSSFIDDFIQSRYVVFRRPRRFGKSLFLSMLKYYFYGAANLFQGLAIFQKTIVQREFRWCPSDPAQHNFPPFPVVHLDFSRMTLFSTALEFSTTLAKEIKAIGERCRCELDSSCNNPSSLLGDLITGLARQPLNVRKQVVILIDEYDAPLNEHLNKGPIFEEVLAIYKSFFTIIKSYGKDLAFVYVTGIASHGMAGIYSGANMFIDSSYDEKFDSMCAITESEFEEAIQATRPSDPKITPEALTAMKVQYNGYSFNFDMPRHLRGTLYNPFFVVNYCNSGKIDDYWGRTSSSSLVKSFPGLVSLNFNEKITLKRNELMDPWHPTTDTLVDCARVLFEAGYFTVLDADSGAGTIQIGVPNEQTRKLLNSDFISSVFRKDLAQFPAFLAAKAAILNGNLLEFFKFLDVLRSQIPYPHAPHFKLESSFAVLTFEILYAMGIDFVCEESSSMGRSDFLIFVSETKTLYVVELKVLRGASNYDKLKAAADASLEQIFVKGYADGQFVHSRKPSRVVHVGVVTADIKNRTRRFAMLATLEPGLTSTPTYQLIKQAKLREPKVGEAGK